LKLVVSFTDRQGSIVMFAIAKVATVTAATVRLAVLAAVLIALGAGAARAESRSSTQPSANATKIAREILELKNSRFLFEAMVPGVIERIKGMLAQTNPTLQKDLEAVAANLRKVFAPRTNEIMNDIAVVYASRFSEAELKEIVVFYRTATGKKVIEFEPRVFDEALEGLKGWQENFGEEVIKRFRAEMKRRGHDL
jgi:uncharacterized protein